MKKIDEMKLVRMHKEKRLTMKEVLEIVSLPCLDIPSPKYDLIETKSYDNALHRWTAFYDKTSEFELLLTTADFLFDEMVVSCDDFLWLLKIKGMVGNRLAFDIALLDDKFTFYSSGMVNNDTGEVMTIPVVNEKFASPQDGPDVSDQVKANVVSRIMWMIGCFFSYVDSAKMNMVVEETKGTGKGRTSSMRGKIKSSDKTNIIYLDAIPKARVPAPDYEKIGNSDPLESGHIRRAHRRTLRHTRFKNHKLYGIKDAIPVRSTWVGPEVATYGNITYTVKYR